MSTVTQIQKPQDSYSVYITNNLKASKEFYARWLDFEVGFEASWFICLQSRGEHKITFALIDEKHPPIVGGLQSLHWL